jgi:hypothetical protein
LAQQTNRESQTPFVGLSNTLAAGLLRISVTLCWCVCRLDLLSGHRGDVAGCGPLQFAHFAAWCSHGPCLLMQVSDVHSCLLPSWLPTHTKHFGSSVHWPKWSRPQQRIHIPPSPRSQDLSTSWRLLSKDNHFARITSAAFLFFMVKTSVDLLMLPLSKRSASVSLLIQRGA